jgi:hypothetical protein
MDSLLVGTRKGLFTLQARSPGYEIDTVEFLGVPVSAVLRDPRDGARYVALDHGHFGVKLHRSDDDGRSWTEVAAPAYPSDAAPASTLLLWSLESAHADEPGALWCGTIPGGLFRSDDRGESWSLHRPLWDLPSRPEWFGGGYDDAGIHSILVDPRRAESIVVGISCGGARATTDAGASWRTGTGMKATYLPPEAEDNQELQDPHRIVRCDGHPDVLWCQHHNGMYRSVDAGTSWSRLHPVEQSDFGFAVEAHPSDPDTAWFVPASSDEVRVPVDGKMSVTRTTDGGKSFTTLTNGLPEGPAYDLVYRHGLALASDHSTLAVGSPTGSLWVGHDGGERFSPVSSHLPPILCLRWIPAG